MLGNILPSQPRRVEEIKSSKIAWFPDPDLLITENSSLVAADIPEILPPQDDDAELRAVPSQDCQTAKTSDEKE